ncbi:MAG: methanogenesis marker protein Mmp4/MtxX [Methanothrix sp.]
MDSIFVRELQEKAKSRRARIGIGIWNADAGLIDSLQSAAEYVDLVLVGEPAGIDSAGLEWIETQEPWRDLARLLAEGKIDGAVRGNLPAGRSMRALADVFGIRVRRLALLQFSDWAFLLGPVGIDEGESMSDRLDLLLGGARLLREMGISPRAAVLSGGRMEDRGRCERVDRSLVDGELIARRAREAGLEAEHKGILIESCRGDDIVIAPEGVSGNLIFRTLLLLCKAESFGAPVLMEKVYVDSSRARGGFDGPVMLASAMVGMRERD